MGDSGTPPDRRPEPAIPPLVDTAKRESQQGVDGYVVRRSSAYTISAFGDLPKKESRRSAAGKITARGIGRFSVIQPGDKIRIGRTLDARGNSYSRSSRRHTGSKDPAFMGTGLVFRTIMHLFSCRLCTFEFRLPKPENGLVEILL